MASARQLSLFRQREEREEAALEKAVARLRAAFGPSCAVRPVLRDTWRPETRLEWQPWDPGSCSSGGARGGDEVPCTIRQRQARNDCEQGPRRGPTRERESAGSGSVIRLLAPAEEIEWESGTIRRAGRPSSRVVATDGPTCVAGEWWTAPMGEEGFDRSYYWLALADGSLLWVFCDRHDGRTYLQGVLD